jgi:hypothetical protein
MGKFVVVYKGGSMAETPEEQEAIMSKWMAWFGDIGGSVTDMGNPFGASTSVGSADPSAGLTGYTILSASDLEQAASLVAGCPVLEVGGSVEVYEAMEM